MTIEIDGPDYEGEAEQYCPTCKKNTPGTETAFGRDRWFVCDVCEQTVDIQPPDDPTL
jgi:hypothetical protein